MLATPNGSSGTATLRALVAADLPATAVTAASYPTSGQVPTFTVDAAGRLTAAGSTTTLTSPSISGPTLSGTVAGTYTIGGTPTLGSNLAAGSNRITGLGAPTAASSDAATASYAESQKTGGGGPVFYLNTGQSWSSGAYLGLGGDGSSTVNVNVVPWVAPVAGTLKNLRIQGLTNSNTNLNVTLYKASAAASPTYSSTALVAAVANGSATGSDASHSVSVSAGDMIVAVSSAFWAVNGCCVSAQFIPT